MNILLRLIGVSFIAIVLIIGTGTLSAQAIESTKAITALNPQTGIKVKLDIPEEMPNAEEMENPTVLFTGRIIRIENPSPITSFSYTLQSSDQKTNITFDPLSADDLVIANPAPDEKLFKIPNIPTGTYTLTLIINKTKSIFNIHIVNEKIPTTLLSGSASAFTFGPQSATVTFRTLICASCDWEGVMDGSGDHLVLSSATPNIYRSDNREEVGPFRILTPRVPILSLGFPDWGDSNLAHLTTGKFFLSAMAHQFDPASGNVFNGAGVLYSFLPGQTTLNSSIFQSALPKDTGIT
jgi:hypothetical protein